MNDRPGDEDLRALFEAQREDDAKHAPSFAELMARVRDDAASIDAVVVTSAAGGREHEGRAARTPAPLRSRHRLEWIGGLAAAAAIAALIVIPRLSEGDDAFEEAVRAFQSDPALGAWQSPTDGLLDMPGGALLTTIPAIGTPQ